MTNDLWTTAEVAEYLKVQVKTADKQLRRWGIAPTGRQPGRGGQNLYPADQVRQRHQARPGPGARTDLTSKD